ncbi:AAA family ATPase [Nakamurella antarctica]|uniref:AAA family ATPase n=1 Tax=Nakamurella antarctica TaxID=1902245 RepID=UPI0013DDB8D2|nr:ATP-binding protein [Nakamurella antarctica]
MTSTSPVAGADFTLFERGAELAVLEKAVGVAVTGDGSAIVLRGPMGIGKSALLAAAAESAAASGCLVLRAQGADTGPAASYSAIDQLLSGLTLTNDWRTADGEVAVMHALTAQLHTLAGSRGLVIVVDDAHWVDEESLRFFAYLAAMPLHSPIALFFGTRPRLAHAPSALIDRIIDTPEVLLLELTVLSKESVNALLAQRLGKRPDSWFTATCLRETGGNPWLLSELAGALDSADISPLAEHSPVVAGLGSQAIQNQVATMTGSLGAVDVAVLHAVAVLGDGVPLDLVTELAGSPSSDRTRAAFDTLANAALFASPVANGSGSFSQPMVRAAVYESIGPAARTQAHRAAAALLSHRDEGASAAKVTPAQAIAATTSTENTASTSILQRAAADAILRGSPESALRYLRRGLAETSDPVARLDMQYSAGVAAYAADPPSAVGYLSEALEHTSDTSRRATLTATLANALMLTGRMAEAIDLLRSERSKLVTARECVIEECAIDDSAEHYDDLIAQLNCIIAIASLTSPDFPGLRDDIAAMLTAPPTTGVGGRSLDGVLAIYHAFRTEPEGVGRAIRAMSDDALDATDPGRGPLQMALKVLTIADVPEALGHLDSSVRRAERLGSLPAVAGAYTYRAHALFLRGRLSDAYQDATTARWATTICGLDNRAFVASVFADICIATGRYADAQATLDWSQVVTSPAAQPYSVFALSSYARLHRVRGDFESGLRLAREVEKRCAPSNGGNPAMVGWRREAALCLFAVGRSVEAAELAAEDLAHARRWGAPGSLAASLRLTAEVGSTSEKVTLLEEATALVRESVARLELAYCLVALGAAKAAAGHPAPETEEGLELALTFGALPLANLARGEVARA